MLESIPTFTWQVTGAYRLKPLMILTQKVLELVRVRLAARG